MHQQGEASRPEHGRMCKARHLMQGAEDATSCSSLILKLIKKLPRGFLDARGRWTYLEPLVHKSVDLRTVCNRSYKEGEHLNFTEKGSASWGW